MKGYMIFLEGKETPKCVHNTINSAYQEAFRLMEEFPDTETMIFRLEKRMKKSADGKPESLGSHFPPDEKQNRINKSLLVTGESLKVKNPSTAA